MTFVMRKRAAQNACVAGGRIQPSKSCARTGIKGTVLNWCMLSTLLLTPLLALPAFSQNGAVSGRLTDSQARPLAGRSVAVVDPATGSDLAVQVSEDDGFYSITGLGEGVYSLEVRLVDRDPIRLEALRIRASETVTANVIVPPARPPESDADPPVVVTRGGRGTTFRSGATTDLPVPSNIWFLIENLEASAVTERVDIGGIEGHGPMLLGSQGSSWTQNDYRVNGARVSDPHETGRTLFYPALAAIAEFEVTSAMHEARVSGPGANVEVQTRRSLDSWHGAFATQMQSRGMQGENLDQDLIGEGVTSSPRFLSVYDGRGNVGGPISDRRAYFFSGYNLRNSSRHVPGFPETVRETVRGGTARMDLEFIPQANLSLVWSTQQLRDSHAGADFRTAPEATNLGTDRFDLYQAHWQSSPTPSTSYTGFVSLADGKLDATFPDGNLPDPSQVEPFRQRTWGKAPFQHRSDRKRWAVGFQLLHLPDAWLGKNHIIQAGYEWSRGSSRSRIDVSGNHHLVFDNLETNPYRSGSPLPMSLIRFNTPVIPRDTVAESSFYASDHIRLDASWALSLGARLTVARGRTPRQESPAGTFAPTRQFGSSGSLISWTSLDPRLGITYKIWSTLSVFRVAYSRYTHLLSGNLLDHGNPNSLSRETYAWQDLNGDLRFQPNELGNLMSVGGGIYSRIDPQLKAPFTREFAISIEQDFRYLDVTLLLTHRRQKNLVQTINTGVPFTAYEAVDIVDPGEDIAGVGDDRTFTVYDQDPATLGQDRFLLTNPDGLEARHRGLQVVIARRSPDRWHYYVTASTYESTAPTNPGNSALHNDPGVTGDLFRDPNTLINADNRLFFDRAYTIKVGGYYLAPWGIRIAGLAKYYDGLPYARNLIVRGLNQGPFLLMATPRGNILDHPEGGPRTESDKQVDLRIRRDIEIKDGHHVSVTVDVYNLLNSNDKTLENDLTGPDFPPRIALDFQAPRSARIGLRYEF